MKEYKNLTELLDAESDFSKMAAVPVPLVAEHLGVSPSAIFQQVQQGKLEAYRIGNHVLVSLDSLFQIAEDKAFAIFQLNDFLTEKAQKKFVSIAYEEPMTLLGLSWRVPHHRRLIGQYLEQVTKESFKEKNVLLSALVHRKGSGLPGEGFFTLAKELGFSWKSREAFVDEHTQAIWKAYS